MGYGKNSPFGLKAHGHLIGGSSAIKQNSNYVISASSEMLNKGDIVTYSSISADYDITAFDNGGRAEIKLYNPTVSAKTSGTATTVESPFKKAVGVFQSCSFEVNGKFIEQNYWIPGTIVSSPVIATIVDDPYVIWDVQLSSYTGARFAALNQFALLPCMQIQNAGFPNTGAGGPTAPALVKSAILGSNIEFLTGSNVGAVAGVDVSATMTGVVINNVVAGFKDNPLMANQGTANGNPLGVSTFYAVPSLAYTDANPLVTDGWNDYARDEAMLKVIGFTPDPRNVPAINGVHPTDPTQQEKGTYFNTPFLNVLVMINNHVNKAPTASAVIA
jgi:hypothetical protein